ncbi:hypothetical protein [uncultured Croceitalea sp.]|uniref:hypothetical protein n=1 Tax=uncultured Croceitalea sp. TaxID=1798908 RepID=UPI0033058AC5
MKKYYLVAMAIIVTIVGCETEEVSSTKDAIDSSIDVSSETEAIVEQENENVTFDEEIEIEEFEEIQNQFFSELEDLDLTELDNLNLDVVDLRNDEQFGNAASSKGSNYYRPRITSLCLIKDADRCPNEGRQPISNMWWPENERDYYNPTTYFSSSRRCRMLFATFSNGTALIRGITNMNDGNCKVYVNVWLKDKQKYDEFTSNGGEFKLEIGCASQAANPEELLYYEIDNKRSWLYSWGNDCVGKGCFGLEQRGENLRGQLGPNGAAFDSNIGAHGFSNWGWITDRHTGERLWVMDFDFRLRCCPRYH